MDIELKFSSGGRFEASILRYGEIAETLSSDPSCEGLDGVLCGKWTNLRTSEELPFKLTKAASFKIENYLFGTNDEEAAKALGLKPLGYPEVENADYCLPGSSLGTSTCSQFINGHQIFEVANYGSQPGVYNQIYRVAQGDLNSDGQNDALAAITYYSAGTLREEYLAVLIRKNGKLINTDSIFFDPVVFDNPEALSISKDGTITAVVFGPCNHPTSVCPAGEGGAFAKRYKIVKGKFTLLDSKPTGLANCSPLENQPTCVLAEQWEQKTIYTTDKTVDIIQPRAGKYPIL